MAISALMQQQNRDGLFVPRSRLLRGSLVKSKDECFHCCSDFHLGCSRSYSYIDPRSAESGADVTCSEDLGSNPEVANAPISIPLLRELLHGPHRRLQDSEQD